MAHVIKILDIQSGYFMEFCSFCSQNQIVILKDSVNVTLPWLCDVLFIK